MHTIEQEKKITRLKEENQALNQELKSLKSDVAAIKALLQNQTKAND